MMNLGAGALLKLLGTGVGLIRDAAGAGQDRPIEGADFRELLDRVSKGELRPGEPVRVDPLADVDLTDEQLARVTEATARLESAGAAKGIVLVDDLAVEVDVLTRTVLRSVDLSGGAAVAGVDAVVRAPGPASGTLAGVPTSISNASLLDLLAKNRSDADAA